MINNQHTLCRSLFDLKLPVHLHMVHKFGSLIVGIFSSTFTFSISFGVLLLSVILVSSMEVDFWHLTFVAEMKIKIIKNR